MQTSIKSLLLLGILALCFACEESTTEPPSPPEPLVLEAYYVGKTERTEKSYVTSYFDFDRMETVDTFYITVDTTFIKDPDTIAVRKLLVDTLYSIDWRLGQDLARFSFEPTSVYTESFLIRGWGESFEYDEKYDYSIYGFGTDSLTFDFYFKNIFTVETMREIEQSFETIRKEPID
ncbi:MAG: hypothetical protein R8P61_30125 [Bacteroidia bacterium]|nr:hypothetical protein [Bacteroidia bacterium]